MKSTVGDGRIHGKLPVNQAGAVLAWAVLPSRGCAASRQSAGQGDKAQRTEVMKELTQAYQAGDLARLGELGAGLAAGCPREASPEAAADTGDSPSAAAPSWRTGTALRRQLGEERPPCGAVDHRRASSWPSCDGWPQEHAAPIQVWLDALRERQGRPAWRAAELRALLPAMDRWTSTPSSVARDLMRQIQRDELDDFDLVMGELLAALTAESQAPKPPAVARADRGHRTTSTGTGSRLHDRLGPGINSCLRSAHGQAGCAIRRDQETSGLRPTEGHSVSSPKNNGCSAPRSTCLLSFPFRLHTLPAAPPGPNDLPTSRGRTLVPQRGTATALTHVRHRGA